MTLTHKLPMAFLLLITFCPIAAGQWLAGVSKVDITPTESVPLAGYGGPPRMSQGVDHPIWLKALALRESKGDLAVIVTADLVGLSQKMVQRIADDAQAKYGISRHRLLLNTFRSTAGITLGFADTTTTC